VPLFDATLVTVLRTIAGRPVSQGGRDHSSHRLVALGLSERRAVILLWSVCVTFGLLALAGLMLDLYAAAVGARLLPVGLFLFGVYRGVWRYVGIRDLINLVKAVLAGSIATVIALLLAYRFQGLSRSVFVLDGLLLLFFTTGARLLIRVFRETLGGSVAGEK